MKLNCIFYSRLRENHAKVIKSVLDKPGNVTEIEGSKPYQLKNVSKLSFECFGPDCSLINFFPRSLSTFFPKLKVLHIDKSSLTSLTKDDLAGLEKLEDFRMISSSLEELPSDLFVEMKKLKRIEVQGSDSMTLSPEILSPIKEDQLEYVFFGRSLAVYVSTLDPKNPNERITVKEVLEQIKEKFTKPDKKRNISRDESGEENLPEVKKIKLNEENSSVHLSPQQNSLNGGAEERTKIKEEFNFRINKWLETREGPGAKPTSAVKPILPPEIEKLKIEPETTTPWYFQTKHAQNLTPEQVMQEVNAKKVEESEDDYETDHCPYQSGIYTYHDTYDENDY